MVRWAPLHCSDGGKFQKLCLLSFPMIILRTMRPVSEAIEHVRWGFGACIPSLRISIEINPERLRVAHKRCHRRLPNSALDKAEVFLERLLYNPKRRAYRVTESMRFPQKSRQLVEMRSAGRSLKDPRVRRNPNLIYRPRRPPPSDLSPSKPSARR
jgi:hypothetical protein